MKLSDTSKDFERVEETTHVHKIVNELNENVPKYFEKITNLYKSEENGIPLNEKIIWSKLVADGISKFEKESQSYQ